MANNQTYAINFRNNSGNRGSSCVYVGKPDQTSNKLAWFTSPARTATFQWTIEYDFVWAETGEFKPGVLFEPREVLLADPQSGAQVTFTKDAGVYEFKDQAPGPAPGNYLIKADGTIPAGFTAVGIGLSGSATYALQAQPNISFQFAVESPPSYSITFGDYEKGQLLGSEAATNAAQIVFPVNIYTMDATLNADGTWTLKPVDN